MVEIHIPLAEISDNLEESIRNYLHIQSIKIPPSSNIKVSIVSNHMTMNGEDVMEPKVKLTITDVFNVLEQ